MKVTVFIGTQGSGKTTAARKTLPEALVISNTQLSKLPVEISEKGIVFDEITLRNFILFHVWLKEILSRKQPGEIIVVTQFVTVYNVIKDIVPKKDFAVKSF